MSGEKFMTLTIMNTQEIKTLSESQTQPTVKHLDYKRPIAAILSDLSKPIPDRFLESRTQGRATLTYYPLVQRL
jgi:hypothetical protein